MEIRSFYLVRTVINRWLMLFGVVLLTLPQSQANPARQDLNSLQQEVAAFLEAHYQRRDISRVDVKVSNLDPRLVLPVCGDPLSMSVNDPSHSGGNLTVQTRCEGRQSWSIYVPAQVALFRSVAIASRNLTRGDVVNESDVRLEVMNVSLLRQGYLVQKEGIVGKELQRPINKGDAFRAATLDAPMVIKRGDEVSIEIQAGMIAVNSTGVALANGRIGQRIRVRNSQSERIVSAEVVDAGRVKTSI